ncbi:LacI family DNA-binding transcriptional regulator [Lactobacillus selangorensis]|uniref:LacI family DNA-binding transcriptional regulator n=1 Tax=Lactobacillus selangorensis TaxID=81857 RepID=UPI0022A9AB97|nr:LacI family DNA-binding transcriptional regulator [Lactobacillus selangorensis]
MAQAAHVSSATVSRVLNADTTLQVSAETRQRIFAAAEDLNYTKKKTHPKTAAGKVAVLEWYSQAAEMDDLYYRNIRFGVENALSNADFDIVRSFSDQQLPETDGLTGIIALGKYSPDQLAAFAATKLPVVVVDQDTLSAGISCVTTDFVAPLRQILQLFIDQKQTKIGMLAGQEETTDHQLLADPRTEILTTLLQAHSLYNEHFIFTGPFTIDSGYQLMNDAIKTLGSSLPTAFFIANDTLAIGAIKALQEHHVAIPDRVSVIGFNDLAVGRYLSPSLSTVHVATTEMGQQAVRVLQSQLDGTTSVPVNLKLSSQLILRQSNQH